MSGCVGKGPVHRLARGPMMLLRQHCSLGHIILIPDQRPTSLLFFLLNAAFLRDKQQILVPIL